MDLNSGNLNSKNNTIYIILSVVLVILSIAGILLLFQIIKTRKDQTIETVSVSVPTPTETAAVLPSVSPTIALSPKASPTASTSATKPSPTLKPTIAPKSATSSATSQNFNSPTDAFSVSYNSSRKLVQDTEATGNRYTFTSTSGNFAIHVATNDKWAWINGSRNFTNGYLIAGQPTFRYDITTQTIVDFQSNGKNYTVQCIHKNDATIKAECDTFMKSIKLL